LLHATHTFCNDPRRKGRCLSNNNGKGAHIIKINNVKRKRDSAFPKSEIKSSRSLIAQSPSSKITNLAMFPSGTYDNTQPIRKVARSEVNSNAEVKADVNVDTNKVCLESRSTNSKESTFTTQVDVEIHESVTRSSETGQKFAPQYSPREVLKSVKLNLPELFVPVRLVQPEEDALCNLRNLLRHHGFDVRDRPTLAFFLIGKKWAVQSAAKCFQKFYKLVNTPEFTSPNRSKLEQMEIDGLFEGFAWNGDGTFGSLVNLGKWNVSHHTAPYITREMLCYVLQMVDVGLLRAGITILINARNLTWRKFAPFEMAKTGFLASYCLPIPMRRKYVIDLGIYGRVAQHVLKPILINRGPRAETVTLSLEQARSRFPELTLPESLSGRKNNPFVLRLSVDEQMNFKLLL